MSDTQRTFSVALWLGGLVLFLGFIKILGLILGFLFGLVGLAFLQWLVRTPPMQKRLYRVALGLCFAFLGIILRGVADMRPAGISQASVPAHQTQQSTPDSSRNVSEPPARAREARSVDDWKRLVEDDPILGGPSLKSVVVTLGEPNTAIFEYLVPVTSLAASLPEEDGLFIFFAYQAAHCSSHVSTLLEQSNIDAVVKYRDEAGDRFGFRLSEVNCSLLFQRMGRVQFNINDRLSLLTSTLELNPTLDATRLSTAFWSAAWSYFDAQPNELVSAALAGYVASGPSRSSPASGMSQADSAAYAACPDGKEWIQDRRACCVREEWKRRDDGSIGTVFSQCE